MIKTETQLKVCDNSGALIVSTIRILGGGSTARIGDTIVVAVKKAQAHSLSKKVKTKVRKGEVRKFLILRTKKEWMRKNGMSIAFADNCGIILNEKLEPVATRIFGPVLKELRTSKFMKVISLASSVI